MTPDSVLKQAQDIEIGDRLVHDCGATSKVEGWFIDGNNRAALLYDNRWHYMSRTLRVRVILP